MELPILFRPSLDFRSYPRRSGLRRFLLGWIVVLGLGVAGPGRGQELDVEARAAPFWQSIFWTYTAGFDFSRGDYGLDRASTLYYVPLGLIADYDRFRFRLVIPFLANSGPTTFAVTGDPAIDPARTTLATETHAGLGEVALSGSYLFDPFAPGLPYLELGTQVTLPTRSKKALGTGTTSFSVRLDAFREWGPVTPFASAGRSFFTSDSLDDRFFASVGGSLAVSEWVAVGLSYDWLEEANGATPDAHELAPFLSVKLGPRWTLGPYAVFGLSDGSPDYGLGVGISFAP